MNLGRRSNRLRSMPVVVVPCDDLAGVVEAGASRAGASPAIERATEMDEPALLAAVDSGAEIVIAVCAGAAAVRSLNAAHQLGGRAIPVIQMANRAGIAGPAIELLCDPSLRDLNVPVPLLEEPLRMAVWDALRAERVEERHHLIEVDGRPALDQLAAGGSAAHGDELQLLAAGAAGVLAGRMAASNRRWS